MSLKLISPILLVCLSQSIWANSTESKPTLSFGASSMALVQSIKYDDSDTTNTFAGIQFLTSGSLTNNFQLQGSWYRLLYTDDSDLSVTGTSFKANMGKGFLSQGFKSYLSLGIFSESFDNGLNTDRFNGLELGAAMGYNLKSVSIDYGFTVRDSSIYQRDSLYGEADVISVTGFLSLNGQY